MANLQPNTGFPNGIYRIETTDAVQGGESGVANRQAKEIAGGLNWLKERGDGHDIKNEAQDAAITAAQSTANDAKTKADTNATNLAATNAKIGSYSGVKSSNGVIIAKEDAGKVISPNNNGVTFPNTADLASWSLPPGTRWLISVGNGSASAPVSLSRYNPGVFQHDGETPSTIRARGFEYFEVIYMGGDILQVNKMSSPQHGGMIGTVIQWFHNNKPDELKSGWIACDGRSLLRSDYPELFAVCGFQYGTGSSNDTFSIVTANGYLIKAK